MDSVNNAMQSAEGDNSNLKHSIKREVITELLDPPGMTSSLLSQEIQCERMWKYNVYQCGNTMYTNLEIQCIRLWKYSVYKCGNTMYQYGNTMYSNVGKNCMKNVEIQFVRTFKQKALCQPLRLFP